MGRNDGIAWLRAWRQRGRVWGGAGSLNWLVMGGSSRTATSQEKRQAHPIPVNEVSFAFLLND